MPPDPHPIDSLLWQTRQLFQRLGEWSEYQLSQLNVEGPELPTWKWLEPLGRGLFWLFIATLALGTGWMLYQGIMILLSRQRSTTVQGVASPPEAVLKQATQWWREAQTLAQQGDYAGACTAHYMAGLLRLNDTQTVPYLTSRTDGEYLTCLPSQTLSRPYELLIRTHERLTFGDGVATEETYQRCRRAYQEITQS